MGVIRALQEWRCFLEGSVGNVLVTEHNPLVWLQSQPSLSRKQARWMEYMSRFHYTWQYRPGRNNVADPLSRNPLTLATLFLGAVTRGQNKRKLPDVPGYRATAHANCARVHSRSMVPKLKEHRISHQGYGWFIPQRKKSDNGPRNKEIKSAVNTRNARHAVQRACRYY